MTSSASLCEYASIYTRPMKLPRPFQPFLMLRFSNMQDKIKLHVSIPSFRLFLPPNSIIQKEMYENLLIIKKADGDATQNL